MAEDIDFSGPRLKIERAAHHIRKLEVIFGRHIRANANTVRRPVYNRSQKPRNIGTALPRHTSTILGDALHNLRAALDHAYCILVKANSHDVNDWSTFPIAKNKEWKSIKGSVEGNAKKGNGPSQAMIDFIFDEIQPYVGGKGEDLSKLHLLDISDKHMILLPAQLRTQADFKIANGPLVTGLTVITSGQGTAVQLGPGTTLEKGYHNKASFEACFGHGQPYAGQSILPTLKDLAARVDETLRLLEQRVKKP